MTLSDKRHAFEAVQREIENRAEALALARLVARRVAAGKGGDLVDLLDERDAAFVERREAEKKFMHAAGAVGADTEHGASATLSALRMRENNADARLDRRIRTLTRKIDDRWPGYRAAAFPPPLSVEEAQRLLSLDEAVIVVAPSTTGTQVVAISQDRIEWREAPDNIFALFETVRRLRWFAGAPVEASDREEAEWSATVDGGIDGFDRATAYHVYKQLFAPFESIFKNKRVLYVAAGGPLDTLPLSILVTAPPEGRDNDPAALRQTHWFGDEVAIASVPSLQSLQSIRQRPASDAQVQFAGFGDPVLAGRSEVRGGLSKHLRPTPAVVDGEQDLSDRGSASLATLRSLASLPGTAMEIRTVAQTFKPQGSVFLGADATERFVRSTDLSRFRIIDFATHGLLAGELAVDSETGLVLTPPAQPSVSDDGFLTASEISGLTLDADWVILSACNTAGGDDSRSTGSSGLARAFFIAGARSLLLSHWQVRDDVAPLLILHTIQHRAQGSSRAEALQLAMRDVRNIVSHDKIDASGLNETWSHPNAWAPFALVGEGH